MKEVLSIETGFGCNQNCPFCPQPPYRVVQSSMIDLSTGEIKNKILRGKKQGFEEVSFSGGEPLLRDDILEIIRFAKNSDFKKIGITTNGIMLENKRFVENLLDEGLTNISISIYGHNSRLHDRIVNKKGAFSAIGRGIKNIKGISNKKGIPVEISIITLITKENIKYLKDIFNFGSSLGIKNYIIQPFTYSKTNINKIEKYFTPLDEIIEALKDAAQILKKNNCRLKLYNLPCCLFVDLNEVVDRENYKIKVFKGWENKERKKIFEGKFFKTKDCENCEIFCSGIRMEFYPEEDIVHGIIKSTREKKDKDFVILSCIEILSNWGLNLLREKWLEEKLPPVKLFYGGTHRAEGREMIKFMESSFVKEIILVFHYDAQTFKKPRFQVINNFPFLIKIKDEIKKSSKKISIIFSVYDILSSKNGERFKELKNLIESFKPSQIHIAIDNPFKIHPLRKILGKCNGDFLKILAERIKSLKLPEESIISFFTSSIMNNETKNLKTFMENEIRKIYPVENIADRYIFHSFGMEEFSWLFFSFPRWLFIL